jgi:hypothetical protein
VSNPLKDYKDFVRSNLPSGITYDSGVDKFVVNENRFNSYWFAKWYRDYLVKIEGFSVGPSVSIGSGPFTTGNELTATVSSLEGGETVTYQWTDDGANITGATSSTYTPAIGTDSVADASDIGVTIIVDGGDPITSSTREIRYAPGSVTESSLSDITIDDDVVNINFASDFTTTNLTGTYVITGLPTGVVDDSDGTASGTATGVPGSFTPQVVFTDQYGRTITGNYAQNTVYRAQATGGADLDLSFVEGTPTVNVDLKQNWTLNGNTLTYTISPALPTGFGLNSSTAVLTRTGTLAVTADDTYTLTGTDANGRETTDTLTLAVTATPDETITIDTLTYTRGAAGVSPAVATDVSSTGTPTAPYTLWGVFAGSAQNKAQIDASGDKFSIGPETNLADLDNSALDIDNSVTGGVLSAYITDSSDPPVVSDVVTETSVTYDAVAPGFSSAVVEDAAKANVVVTFSKAAYGSTSASDWDVQVDGSPATENSVSFTPGGTTATITLSADVANGDTVTVAYTGSGIVGVDAEVMATFTAQSVTNNVAAAGLSLATSDNFEGGFSWIENLSNWEFLEDADGQGARLGGVARLEAKSDPADWTFGFPGGSAWTDQSAKFTVTNLGTDTALDYGPMVRASDGGTAVSGYCALYDRSAGSFTIQELTNGTATTIDTHTATLSANDTVELEIIGTTLKLYINDTEVWSGTDATHSSGTVGVRTTAVGALNEYWEMDNFEGYN